MLYKYEVDLRHCIHKKRETDDIRSHNYMMTISDGIKTCNRKLNKTNEND